MTTRRTFLILAICSIVALAACGGSDSSRSSGSASGGGGHCELADASAVAAAVGVSSVDTQDLSPGCGFNGPKAAGFTVDRVLEVRLIEGDGAVQFGPTSDELSLGIDGSRLSENDQGWFSYSALIGDERLTVANGQDTDGVYYDSAELRVIAKQALDTWVTEND